MSYMLKEARESAAIVANQDTSQALALAEALKSQTPRGIVSVARGTSDHALGYLGYLLMHTRGMAVASLPPSLSSVLQTPWQVQDYLALGASQSGSPPDVIAMLKALAAGGARTATLVNVVPSPIIEASQHVLAVQAGPEKSVAATKSFIATVALGLHLLAHWNGDRKLQDALQALPDKLEQAANADWAAAVEALTPRERLFVVGRGTGLSIAQEAALKCKETCQLQGEAFSTAEVQHGPMAIVHDGFPVLLFAPPDHYQADALQLAEKFAARGAQVLLASDKKVAGTVHLPHIDAGHDALQGLTGILSWYVAAAQLSEARGLNPDEPPYLQKVTQTV